MSKTEFKCFYYIIVVLLLCLLGIAIRLESVLWNEFIYSEQVLIKPPIIDHEHILSDSDQQLLEKELADIWKRHKHAIHLIISYDNANAFFNIIKRDRLKWKNSNVPNMRLTLIALLKDPESKEWATYTFPTYHVSGKRGGYYFDQKLVEQLPDQAINSTVAYHYLKYALATQENRMHRIDRDAEILKESWEGIKVIIKLVAIPLGVAIIIFGIRLRLTRSKSKS